MRRALLTCLLLVASGTGTAEQLYLNAQLALSKPSAYGSGAELLLAAGTQVPQHRDIFLEAELAGTLLAPERDSRRLTHYSLGGYGIYRRMLDERLAIHGKLGMLYQYSESEQGELQNGMGIAVGIGATIRHSRSISYLIEGTTLQGTMDLIRISAGFRYRFH